MNKENIRNFCIIAHIDHGKSTLADRFLEITGTVKKRDLKDRTLDSMDLERERGITIKLKAVRMEHKGLQLNLIDTPGHVDFSYEVSRSLAACEGALLLIDASQGIQAQTVSNVYKALDAGLAVIPIINKIDLSQGDVVAVEEDIVNTFGFKKEEIVKVSAKTGEGVNDLLDVVVKKIPCPKSSEKRERALIFDTFYDEYLGVVAAVRVFDGEFSSDLMSSREKIVFLATGAKSIPEEVGFFGPDRIKTGKLSAGEVGYIATGLKNIHLVKVGDTITVDKEPFPASLPGYKNIKPFVFVSIFPIDGNKYKDLRTAIEKLSLSDASLVYEPENSPALGFGFRCGFLGLLHADIVQERLEREYKLELLSTTPSVMYELELTDGKCMSIKSASDFPDRSRIKETKEPWILLNIVSPSKYVGSIISLCEGRRGIQKDIKYPSKDRALIEYELPLVELVYNFFDELKTVTSGYASLDYEFLDNKKVDVVKLDILVHEKIVEPFSRLVLKSQSREIGRETLRKLKELLPRQQFKVALQAVVGGKIIARENIPSAGKHVLGGIYGGHRERKDKLLERQKKGKERLKKIGKVEIPQKVFRKILSL